MATIQKFVVNAPRPLPPRYRLLDVANVIEEADRHWQTGLQVWGYPPTGEWVPDGGAAPDFPATWALCTSDGTSIKAEGGTIPLPDFDAFTVYVTETCTARSVFDSMREGETQDEYQARVQQQFTDRALAALNAAESWAVEREFSQGLLLPGNPYLSDAQAVILSATAEEPRTALSRLSQAVGQTGQQGIIHADPATIISWGEFFIRPEGSQLVTMDGIPIVRGAGYIGAVPVGQGALADGESWVFATGPVDIRRSQPFVNPGNVFEALDRGNNTITYYVERTYAVDWDTVLQAATKVDWKL